MVATTFTERLNLALDATGYPSGRERIPALRKEFKVSYEAVRKWLAGESNPDSKKITKLAELLDINTEWLLSGRGEMQDAVKASKVGEPYPRHLTADQRRMLEIFDNLAPSQQQGLLALLGGRTEVSAKFPDQHDIGRSSNKKSA